MPNIKSSKKSVKTDKVQTASNMLLEHKKMLKLLIIAPKFGIIYLEDKGGCLKWKNLC